MQINTWMNAALQTSQGTMKPCCCYCKLCSKPEAKKKFSDILTEIHDGVFYRWLSKKLPWMLFLFTLWRVCVCVILKVASDIHFVEDEKDNSEIVMQLFKA